MTSSQFNFKVLEVNSTPKQTERGLATAKCAIVTEGNIVRRESMMSVNLLIKADSYKKGDDIKGVAGSIEQTTFVDPTSGDTKTSQWFIPE